MMKREDAFFLEIEKGRNFHKVLFIRNPRDSGAICNHFQLSKIKIKIKNNNKAMEKKEK